MLLPSASFVVVVVGLADWVERRTSKIASSDGPGKNARFGWQQPHVRMQRIVGFRQACHLRQDVTD